MPRQVTLLLEVGLGGREGVLKPPPLGISMEGGRQGGRPGAAFPARGALGEGPPRLARQPHLRSGREAVSRPGLPGSTGGGVTLRCQRKAASCSAPSRLLRLQKGAPARLALLSSHHTFPAWLQEPRGPCSGSVVGRRLTRRRVQSGGSGTSLPWSLPTSGKGAMGPACGHPLGKTREHQPRFCSSVVVAAPPGPLLGWGRESLPLRVGSTG